jgi:hypothetical protein
MEASRPNRVSATAGRRISGSPKSPRPHAQLAREGAPAECSTITREIAVRGDKPPRPSAAEGSVWPLRNTWNRGTENLYSAWIEKLFDDPLDAAPSWPALHEVLRDRSRNFLFNHLGLGEDEMRTIIRPDCADLPYFLRAYFAFKMGLPFGYSKCSRGGHGEGPKCYSWWNIQKEEPPSPPQKPRSAPHPRCFASQSRVRRAQPWRTGRGSLRASAIIFRRSPTASIPAPRELR